MKQKRIVNFVILAAVMQVNLYSQGISFPEGKKVMAPDSMKQSEMPTYKNRVSVGAKYLLNPLSNTAATFASSGFVLDEQAIEYQLRIHNLPKMYYYQQLGSLTSNGNYVSVTGFGLKEDIRFDMVKSKNFILAPYFELGGGYFRANVSRGITNNSVSTVLSNTVSQSGLDNFVVSGDVGLDLGVAFSLDQTRVAIVINGGYLSNFPTPWRVAGSLAFKERINLSSPYAGMTIRIELEDACCAGYCEPMKR